MDNDIQIRCSPRPVVFDSFDFSLVGPFKYPVACNVIPFLLNIFPYPSEDVSVIDPRGLQQCREIVYAEMAVRTAMALSASWRVFAQDLLARKGRISAASAICIAADVTVGMTDVVPVFLVEGIIRDQTEGVSPKRNAVLHRQAYAFEEERVLQPAKMFQMTVFSQRKVQIPHAQREMLGKSINGGCVNGGSRQSGIRIREC